MSLPPLELISKRNRQITILYIVYEIDLVVIIYIYIRLSPVPVPYIHQTEVVTDREGEFLTELNAKSEIQSEVETLKLIKGVVLFRFQNKVKVIIIIQGVRTCLTEQAARKVRTELTEQSELVAYRMLISEMYGHLQIIGVTFAIFQTERHICQHKLSPYSVPDQFAPVFNQRLFDVKGETIGIAIHGGVNNHIPFIQRCPLSIDLCGFEMELVP